VITFRQLGETDLELLHGWLNQPHVSEWWGGPQALQKVRSDYLEPAPTDRTTYYVVDCDDAEIGLIQRYPWSAERPNYIQAIGALAGEVGIDYLIGVPALVGVGLGPPDDRHLPGRAGLRRSTGDGRTHRGGRSEPAILAVP
jgi:aminoglycoside 6'-N-acetyltransferase